MTDYSLKPRPCPTGAYEHSHGAPQVKCEQPGPGFALLTDHRKILIPTIHRQTDKTLPIRVGFVVNTFSFGGSETETIELVRGSSPDLLRFTGIAIAWPQPLPVEEPPRDGSFPLLYMAANEFVQMDDPRVCFTSDFQAAVRTIVEKSDLIITWGVADLARYIPPAAKIKIVLQSKDSGEWARSFLRPNSLATSHWVGNSTLAASAYPEAIQKRVRVIHDGINPDRVKPKLGRAEQRSLWNLREEDKVVGYLGRIEYDKGVGKTVDAVAQLQENWKAVFIGLCPTSRYAEQLQQHCDAAIPGRYRLLDWCHDVGSALAAFDVFCHPSEHEGFSNSLGEAWLAGVPTVYTAGTGAAPDLGDLGVPVSHDAGAQEVADAVLSAYGNAELVEHARAVMNARYLSTHYAERWTEYLLDVYNQAHKLRVLLFYPADLLGMLDRWLSAFHRSYPDSELCSLLIHRALHRLNEAEEKRIYSHYACPVFYSATESQLESLVTYTRPDVILTFPGLAGSASLAEKLSIPMIVAEPNARPGCFAQERDPSENRRAFSVLA